MSEFYVTMFNDVTHNEFLSAQAIARQTYVYTTDDAMVEFINEQLYEERQFCINTRVEFLANVTAYFSDEHNITSEKMESRYKEVCS